MNVYAGNRNYAAVVENLSADGSTVPDDIIQALALGRDLPGGRESPNGRRSPVSYDDRAPFAAALNELVDEYEATIKPIR